MERIFIQIPSYRDPELVPTLEDLFAKAAHPERLSVAVCLQSVPGEFPDPPSSIGGNKPITYIRVHAQESRGVCWARHLLQQQWTGEEYALQIDSHMRFEKDWDRTLIKLLAMCPGRKSLLTSYPPIYELPNTVPRRYISVMFPTHFDEYGTLLLGSFKIPLAAPLLGPLPGALCGACFLFGPAEILSEAPYDPHLYFFGEEISLSVRLWTHGWDIYHPHIPVVYHSWERKHRSLHWDDVAAWRSMDATSRKRVNHLLGVETAPADALIEIEKYGLGKERSLAEYEMYSGIDFLRQSVSNYRLKPPAEILEPEPLEPFSW